MIISGNRMPIHTRRLRGYNKASIAAAVPVLPELELDSDVWDEGFKGMDVTVELSVQHGQRPGASSLSHASGRQIEHWHYCGCEHTDRTVRQRL